MANYGFSPSHRSLWSKPWKISILEHRDRAGQILNYNFQDHENGFDSDDLYLHVKKSVFSDIIVCSSVCG